LVIVRYFALTLKHTHSLILHTKTHTHTHKCTHAHAQTCTHFWQSFADVTGTIRRLNTQLPCVSFVCRHGGRQKHQQPDTHPWHKPKRVQSFLICTPGKQIPYSKDKTQHTHFLLVIVAYLPTCVGYLPTNLCHFKHSECPSLLHFIFIATD